MARLKGKLSKEEWKELRSNALYSRGDRSKKGNLNTRIVWNEKGHYFQLEVANPLHSTKRVAERMTFKLHVPEKRFNEVAQLTMAQETFVKNEKGKIKTIEYYEPYTIELKIRNGKCYVLLTYDIAVYGKELTYGDDIPSERVAGMDINIDKIAVSILTREGRRLESKTFYCHEMEYVRGNRRSNIAGEMAKEIIDYLLSWNVGVFILEELNIKQTHDTNKTFNRKTTQFAYRKMHKALMARGLKDGFTIKQVNPAYTSVIGRFKYSHMYGLSVHEAASFVIGRRGLGMDEKIPKKLLQHLKEKVKPHLIALLGSMEESEKANKSGKQKRQFLALLLKNIHTFKEHHNWKLWNVIHKTLRIKNQDILLLEEV
ncbi:IS605 OrfB family transposase [Bacillus fengqiuensis]|nr:IS605 OrfB family transposase [Bacillus fengqiuensis]